MNREKALWVWEDCEDELRATGEAWRRDTPKSRATPASDSASMVSDSVIAGDFAFLTVVEHPRLGLVGGLLVLNEVGRPLEFHCTAPVRANRAQEILYGNTLAPFLYGEQIARTLLDKVISPRAVERAMAERGTAPQFVFTDVMPVLAVTKFVSVPVVYVPSAQVSPLLQVQTSEAVQRSLEEFGIGRVATECDPHAAATLKLRDMPGLSVAAWRVVELGTSGREIAVPAVTPEEAAALAEQIVAATTLIDLTEPFTRVRLAIDEAQKDAA